MACPDQKKLDEIFPASIADEFFDAIYGGAEEGAYDIALVCQGASGDEAHMAFELRRRPGKCLRCSLTSGLPPVFERHRLLNLSGLAQKVAAELGWAQGADWRVAPVREISEDLHILPFELRKKA